MTTTPQQIKELSDERRKDMVEILETVEGDDAETIEDLKDLFAVDGDEPTGGEVVM